MIEASLLEARLRNVLGCQDEVKEYILDDDYILWCKKESDDDGDYIHGEIVSKGFDGHFSDIVSAFTYDDRDDLTELSEYIIKQVKDDKER